MVSPFVNMIDITSLFAAELEVPKIGVSGKGLKAKRRLLTKKFINKNIILLNVHDSYTL